MTPPPVIAVCCAFGVGKTTLAELVAPLLPECLVLDVDWLLPSLSVLAGRDIEEDPSSWEALRQVWLTIAAVSGKSGRPTVLFTPTHPNELEPFVLSGDVGQLVCLHLDCSDAEIVARLKARKDWQEQYTAESLVDAAKLRSFGLPVIRTDDGTPDHTADAVVHWIRERL